MLLAALFLHDLPSPPMCLALILIVGGMLLTVSTGEKESQVFPQITVPRTVLVFGGLALFLSLFTASILFLMLRWLELNLWLILFCCLCEAICIFLACCLVLVPSLAQLRSWWVEYQQQSGLLFGIGAMLGFGIEYFLLSLASAHLGPVPPVVASRLCSALLLFASSRHQHIHGWGEIKLKHFGLIALIGLLDVLGTISYTVGSSQNTMLVAALSSTYPLLPFLVGVLWYRERISRAQWAGVGVMIFGMIGLSL
jgi:drug/metabolite transporter (DMT)-like permease